MPVQPESERTEFALGSTHSLDIRLPDDRHDLDQDHEWCEVKLDGEWRRIRFHDYPAIYNIPGLYEQLFHERLECASPERVVSLLADVVSDQPDEDPSGLRVLDLGAGNGLVGAELASAGAEAVVGLDIIPEARDAAIRDRGEAYDDYVVADMATPDDDAVERLEEAGFNCLTSVAALGFNDIPPEAFANSFNVIEDGGWVAFNVKDSFLSGDDDTGFARLIERMLDDEAIDMFAYRKYVHRLNVAGEPLRYVAMVGRKNHDVVERVLRGVGS